MHAHPAAALAEASATEGAQFRGGRHAAEEADEGGGDGGDDPCFPSSATVMRSNGKSHVVAITVPKVKHLKEKHYEMTRILPTSLRGNGVGHPIQRSVMKKNWSLKMFHSHNDLTSRGCHDDFTFPHS